MSVYERQPIFMYCGEQTVALSYFKIFMKFQFRVSEPVKKTIQKALIQTTGTLYFKSSRILQRISLNGMYLL